MLKIRKDCTKIDWPLQGNSALPKPGRSLADRRFVSASRRLAASIAALYILGMFTMPAAHANAADQARRITHFQWLQARGIYQSMGVVNGVPQLVLGPQRTLSDNNAMAAFCQIIFDYFVENDPTVTNMVVIDSITGNQFAIVDSIGFHLS